MPSSTITVKLANPGSRVRNPSTARRLEPEEEYEVPNAKYWQDLIKRGIVVRVTKKG